MVTISICIGSACHLRGAQGVLNAFISLVERHGVQAVVDISGNFCKGRCTEGVVIQIDDEVITNVSKEKVHDIFLAKVIGR